MSRIKKCFHWAIIGFAVADVAMGVFSLFIDDIVAQVVALIVTAFTLYLTIIYAMLFCKQKKVDIGGILIGSADFLITAISVMIVAFSVQILELIASGMTLFKTVKIVVQSDKAKRLLKIAKPIAKKALVKVAPMATAYIATKFENTNKNKGVFSMEKVKEFFVKLGNLIRANKICLLETLLNGGAWGVLGWLADGAESVAIEVAGFNITPLFSILGFILVEIGFQWESFGAFISRISPKLEAKLAKKKAKEEEKAKKEAEAERARILAEIEAEEKKAELEKNAELEREHEAEREAEEKAKREEEDRKIAEYLARKNNN